MRESSSQKILKISACSEQIINLFSVIFIFSSRPVVKMEDVPMVL